MTNKKDYNAFFQIIVLIFMLLFFIWENRNVAEEDQIFFWIIFAVAIVGVIILFISLFLKEKFDQIKNHEKEIRKLKEELSFREKLDKIYFELGKLNEKRGIKK